MAKCAYTGEPHDATTTINVGIAEFTDPVRGILVDAQVIAVPVCAEHLAALTAVGPFSLSFVNASVLGPEVEP